MGFLQSLLQYQNICIQCHNNPDPDTIASAFGIYSYLKSHTINARMVYGGPQMIEKSNLKLMLNMYDISEQEEDNVKKMIKSGNFIKIELLNKLLQEIPVLKLDIFEETIQTYIGNLFHYVLSKAFNDSNTSSTACKYSFSCPFCLISFSFTKSN